MHSSTKRTGLAVAGALTAAALVVPGIAIAQSDDTTDETTEDGTEQSADDRVARHAERRQAFIDALAEELDISPGELAEAIENVRAEFREQRLAALRERLDQKVADGELTQERADEIHERAENGEWPFGRRRHHGPRGRFGPGGPHADAGDGTDDGAAEDSSLDA